MNVYDCSFKHVCNISPKTDSHDQILEFFPQDAYKNKKNLSLHKYGRGPFCKFSINKEHSQKLGVYLMAIDNCIFYVGECEDLYQRFSMGYGNISPRNCFDGGQPTNCRINTEILKNLKKGNKVQLYFFETEDRFEIEHKLIAKLNPIWNKTVGKPSKI